MICLIRAHLKVYLIGQSLIVLSSTTALFMISFPVINDEYLLFYSFTWACFGSMLLQTSPKTQQAPLHINISTILAFPIFIAIFSGEVQLFGGLGEHFISFNTCLSIFISPEYTAECIIETWLKMLFTLIFIFFSVKYSMSSIFPYLTAYMKGFQLLGVQNSLMRWGKVLKKLMTCLVYPCSKCQWLYISSKILY